MTGEGRPALTVIGGPNGSGKSTLTRSVRHRLGVPVIDPDAIARQLRPVAPESVAVEAGREAIRQQTDYLARGVGFAVETTVSGHTVLRLMEQARQRGFTVNLIFVGIDDPQTNIQRVAPRVATGGHHVPDDDVRRRYERSMGNLARAIAVADHATVFDNSTDQGPIEVLICDAGAITLRVQELPAWVTLHLGAFLARGRG